MFSHFGALQEQITITILTFILFSLHFQINSNGVTEEHIQPQGARSGILRLFKHQFNIHSAIRHDHFICPVKPEQDRMVQCRSGFGNLKTLCSLLSFIMQ